MQIESGDLFNGIDHIDMAVDDVELSATFYEKIGFEVVRRTTHVGGSVELRYPGPGAQPVLELVPCIKPDGSRLAMPGVRHIGLLCKDIRQAQRELIARGFQFKNEPRYVKDTARWLCNTMDPSGIVVQLVGKDASDSHGAIT